MLSYSGPEDVVPLLTGAPGSPLSQLWASVEGRQLRWLWLYVLRRSARPFREAIHGDLLLGDNNSSSGMTSGGGGDGSSASKDMKKEARAIARARTGQAMRQRRSRSGSNSSNSSRKKKAPPR